MKREEIFFSANRKPFTISINKKEVKDYLFTSFSEMTLFLKKYLMEIYNFEFVSVIKNKKKNRSYFIFGHYITDKTKKRKVLVLTKKHYSFFNGWSNYICTYGNVL